MDERAFFEGLDPAQREAVATDAAPLCILAGAGSGPSKNARSHNDRADAFRHCMWSAMMTKSANAGFAKRYGDAHEYGDHGQPIPERRMDLHNNTWGRDTGYRYEGRTQRDTAYECRQLSYNGTLAIRPF